MTHTDPSTDPASGAQHDQSGVLANPFLLPDGVDMTMTGEKLYDTLMSEIEPELTTSQLPLLKEKYKNETAEDGQKRIERYNKAYEQFEARSTEYMEKMKVASQNYQRYALKTIESFDRQADEQAIADMEKQMSSL